MRTDVKLGVAFSMAIVLIAGTYYFYRDSESKPISLSDQAAAPAKKTRPGGEVARSPAVTEHRSKTTMPPRIVRPGNPADSSKEPRVARRTPSAAPERAVHRTMPPANESGRAQGAGNRTVSKRTSSPMPSADRNPKVATARDAAEPAAGAKKRPIASAEPTQPAPGERTAAPTPIIPKQPVASKAADRTEPSTQKPNDVAVDVHHVQPGDSFASLARTYYGSERLTQFLIDHNKQITDPARLRVGMKVNVPPAPTAAGIPLAARSAGAPAAEARKGAAGAGRTYTVKPGDSFYVIARDVLGDATRWKELLAMNSDLVHGDPTKLQPNQIVQLPKE